MVRMLLVITGAIDVDLVRRRWSEGSVNVTEPYEVAICHVLPSGKDSLRETLRAQQAITAALRLIIGGRAEAIPVLVASDRSGDRVEDYAREWGATLVAV